MKIARKHVVITLFLVWILAARQSANAAEASLKDAVTEGKFGTALNAAWAGAEAAKALPAYSTFPLTVEFWYKFRKTVFATEKFILTMQPNILIANEPRESADHWELYMDSGWGTSKNFAVGTLAVSLPGMTPDIINSPKSIADGEWHYVAMVIDWRHVTLYVDGEEVITASFIGRRGGTVVPGKLSVGKAVSSSVSGTFGLNGAIDDLRLSNVVREIHGIPTAPLTADAHTIGLWSFDYVEGAKEFTDASANANPIEVIAPAGASLDDIEHAGYKAGVSPLDSKAEIVPLKGGAAETPATAATFSLDGPWQLVEGVTPNWEKAIAAVVPGSVHTALYQAGIIPFPYDGRNQEIAAKCSARTYWYRRSFSRPPAGQDQTLLFHGICNRCTIWLNGKELGQHEGMFTCTEFPIHDLLQDTNILIVKLDPAIDWIKTMVPNIFYGPFYAKIPALGIWQSVEIRGEPAVKVRDPFIATRDVKTGLMDLVATIAGPKNGWAGKLVGTVTPETFQGKPQNFEYSITSSAAAKELHLQFTISDPQLWWPVDMGKPNLYRLILAFLPVGGGAPDVRETTFGIRTVRMAPVNGKANPRLYNWTFVINGRPMFVKGSNWCTCDAMMDFSRARYERFLTLAARQHIQMLRAWGYGMVETDDFYDLCDRKGIMVMQEWPTTWNSHYEQPFNLLEDTVRENTLRLRNHPSLAIYTGGNESWFPFGLAIDMMGRLNIELDGTRVFHRGEPWGGSQHGYGEKEGIDLAFSMQAIFFGELGFSYSYPNYESVQRFLPDDEKNLWPAPPDKTLAYHTRQVNTAWEVEVMMQSSRYFTAGQTMERFIIGTQLAQAVGVRHILERARTRWPESTGALYFKFNEMCPAAERTSVDWYGAPKIPYYFIQDSFAPLVAVTLFPKATTHGEALTLPAYLLDDADALSGVAWEVIVRAYGADLKLIKESRFPGSGSVKRVAKLGEFTLTAEQTKTVPLLVVTDVMRNGALAKRNYYFTNFEPVKDCLFNLPKTKLSMRVGNGNVVVQNEGPLPAIGVNVSRPGHLDSFFAEENYFWLEPGEVKSIAVNTTEGTLVNAWNADSVGK